MLDLGTTLSPVATQSPGTVEVRVGARLTLDVARPLCRAVRALAYQGASAIRLGATRVEHVDVVGLAALEQSARFAARVGIDLTVAPGPRVREALLEGHLLDALALDDGAELPGAVESEPPRLAPELLIGRTPRLSLRLPRRDDLAHFGRWAADPLLTRMVSSELLYRCRHLGHEHPGVGTAILRNPTALTVLVEPRDRPGHVVGFLRLYDIQLHSGFAFIETVISGRDAVRRGWGIEASRFLVSYAMDALDLHRVEAKAFPYNTLSINALLRNGFREEGILREAHVRDGQRWDILVFSILREQMAQQRGKEQYPYMGFWPAAA